MSRFARRVDANHAQVASALTQIGAVVVDVSRAAGAGLDLIVAFRGRLYAMEVKDGAKVASARKLTNSEQRLASDLARVGCVLHVVAGVDEAMRVIGATA